MIGFAFDFTSTASLLAFKPTCALADELGVAIDWLPFATEVREAPRRKDGESADSAVSADSGESVGERHALVRTEYFARDAARYAKLQGIDIARDAAGVDSTLACAGCLWAKRYDRARAYTEQVLFAFWAGRLDIEDRDAIDSVLIELGAPGFATFGSGELAAHRATVEQRGVFNVPTYLVAEQIFIGRQHLPMIRWLLTSQQGRGPL